MQVPTFLFSGKPPLNTLGETFLLIWIELPYRFIGMQFRQMCMEKKFPCLIGIPDWVLKRGPTGKRQQTRIWLPNSQLLSPLFFLAFLCIFFSSSSAHFSTPLSRFLNLSLLISRRATQPSVTSAVFTSFWSNWVGTLERPRPFLVLKFSLFLLWLFTFHVGHQGVRKVKQRWVWCFRVGISW